MKIYTIVLLLFTPIFIFAQDFDGKIVIDEGHTHTNSIRRNVSVTVDAKNAQMMQISNQKDFKTAVWETFSKEFRTFKLDNFDGKHFIYVRFKDLKGNISHISESSIILDRKAPSNCKIVVNDGVKSTTSNKLKIKFYAQDAMQMYLEISGNQGYLSTIKEAWQPYQENYEVELPADQKGLINVRASFMDEAGNRTIGIIESIIIK